MTEVRRIYVKDLASWEAAGWKAPRRDDDGAVIVVATPTGAQTYVSRPEVQPKLSGLDLYPISEFD